jgi:pSer/pThr/pTyr-binding forkhead associated (FHA) protein
MGRGAAREERNVIRLVIEAELLSGGRKKTRVFDRTPIFVGRGEDADFRIDVDGVSAIHGRIAVAKGGFEYADLSSRNGSFLDGRRLSEDAAASLQPESNLVLADVVRIHVHSGSALRLDDGLDPVLRGETASVDAPMSDARTIHRSNLDFLPATAVNERALLGAGASSPSTVLMPSAVVTLPLPPVPLPAEHVVASPGERLARTEVLVEGDRGRATITGSVAPASGDTPVAAAGGTRILPPESALPLVGSLHEAQVGVPAGESRLRRRVFDGARPRGTTSLLVAGCVVLAIASAVTCREVAHLRSSHHSHSQSIVEPSRAPAQPPPAILSTSSGQR